MLPRELQRKLGRDAVDMAELDVTDAWLERFDQLGRLYAEGIKHVPGLVIDLARAAGYVILAGERAF